MIVFLQNRKESFCLFAAFKHFDMKRKLDRNDEDDDDLWKWDDNDKVSMMVILAMNVLISFSFVEFFSNTQMFFVFARSFCLVCLWIMTMKRQSPSSSLQVDVAWGPDHWIFPFFSQQSLARPTHLSIQVIFYD